MDIQNLTWKSSGKKRQNHPLLPRSIRGLIVGKSGSGKTTVLMNLLLQPRWLDYNNLFVYGKSLFQPEYKIIKTAFECGFSKELVLHFFKHPDEFMRQAQINKCEIGDLIHEIGQELSNKQVNTHFFESADDVPDPSSLCSGDKNLIIFDDVMLQKQNAIEQYYIRGRHNNVDCFYLSQNYFKPPRQTVRENANLIILFPQDIKTVEHIYPDHASLDMSLQEFRNLCKKAWSQPHGFVCLDLSSKKDEGKYRSAFDNFYFCE